MEIRELTREVVFPRLGKEKKFTGTVKGENNARVNVCRTEVGLKVSGSIEPEALVTWRDL